MDMFYIYWIILSQARHASFRARNSSFRARRGIQGSTTHVIRVRSEGSRKQKAQKCGREWACL